ncbi:MAG: hypothetical protein JWM21_2783 [Acidobacteria bacterium]|nr:hypothetical protein [Acidobacteriota bacterium]
MTNVKCRQCGLINRLADEKCESCGAELSATVPSPDTSTAEYLLPSIDLESSEPEHPEELPFSPVVPPFDGISTALSPTITLFKDNIWLITKIVVVIFAPFEIFKALSLGTKQTDWQVGVGIILLAGFCKALVSPSLIFALITVMRTGVAPSLNETYRWGLSRIGKVAVVALLATILQTLGYICLIVPGVILTLGFEVIYPLAALEDLGPIEILKRSYSLTKGYKGNIFGVRFVFGLLLLVVALPAGFVSTMLIASGVTFWPLQALLGMTTDIFNESTTVLSLVIYLSILKARGPGSFIESNGPPPPPAFE